VDLGDAAPSLVLLVTEISVPTRNHDKH